MAASAEPSRHSNHACCSSVELLASHGVAAVELGLYLCAAIWDISLSWGCQHQLQSAGHSLGAAWVSSWQVTQQPAMAEGWQQLLMLSFNLSSCNRNCVCMLDSLRPLLQPSRTPDGALQASQRCCPRLQLQRISYGPSAWCPLGQRLLPEMTVSWGRDWTAL